MIKKDYSYVNAPSGFRLLKQNEAIRRDDIYYAEIEKINPYNIATWRKCVICIGRKFSPKKYMPVARRI